MGFKQIAEANEILRDPQQRAAYDHQLNNPIQRYSETTGSSGGGFGFWGFGFGYAPRERMKTPEEQAWEKARQERADRAYERACRQAEKEAAEEEERAEK